MRHGFGWGGPNAQPSRGRPEYGTNDTYRDLPEFVGGQRGVVALPSRTIVAVPPAPAQPLVGPHGPVSAHRGAFVEDAGAPRLEWGGVLGHGHIPWARPVFANRQGLDDYVPPVPAPSWTADVPGYPVAPAVGIPVSNKRLPNMTVREEFGSTRERFNTSQIRQFWASIQVGRDVQGRRWLKQAKTQSPWQPNLSVYGPAGSYGQTTKVLPTAPSNVPPSYSSMGAY